MKLGSIRVKLALAAAALSALGVVLFAAFSDTWFYFAQVEEAREASGGKLTPDDIADAQGDAKELIGVYLLVLPIIAAAAAAGAWWVAGRFTNPLIHLAETASRIDSRTLHERLPEPTSDDEIALLARVLNHAFERLEHSFWQASRFAADASHELRTPVAMMRARIEIAIQSDPSSPYAPMLVELLEDSQRLAAITEKLLLLARADAGKLLPEWKVVSLSDMISTTVEDFTVVISDRSLCFDTEITPNVSVQGDAALLRQLFLNLFDNAAKYNHDEGSIQIRLERQDAAAIFTITNTGPVIEPEMQPRLFERFFRSSDSRDRETGGAGLGLSLCREIASAHGGELKFLSSNESGTTFQVILPVA